MPRFALLAETKIFEEQQHVDGEGIIKLYNVDIRWRRPGQGKGSRTGLRRGGYRQVGI